MFAVLWIIFWASGIFAVLDLNLLEKIANSVGVGRGADLVLYLSIVLIFYLIFVLFIKINEVSRKITKIIRGQALKNAKNLNKR
jgi:hypothetical protein